jgi:hypothetical protein
VLGPCPSICTTGKLLVVLSHKGLDHFEALPSPFANSSSLQVWWYHQAVSAVVASGLISFVPRRRQFEHNSWPYLQQSRPRPTFFTTNQPSLSHVVSIGLLKDRSGECTSTLNTSWCSNDLQPLLGWANSGARRSLQVGSHNAMVPPIPQHSRPCVNFHVDAAVAFRP